MGYAFAPLALLLVLTGGCGGGGHQSGTPMAASPTAESPASGSSSARFAVAWPERTSASASRLVPVAANSIKITVQKGDAPVGSVVIARPENASAGQVTSGLIENLPEGNLTVSASAYPNADGTGTAQASATLPVTLAPGELKDVSLTLASTIDHIEVAPLSTSGAPPSVYVWRRNTTLVSATARDASGAAVLTALDKWKWSTADVKRATVISVSGNTALIKAGALLGSADVSASEIESGKQAALSLKVRGYDIKKLSGYPERSSPFFLTNSVGQIAGRTENSVWLWTPVAVGATEGTVQIATAPTVNIGSEDDPWYFIYGIGELIDLSDSGNVVGKVSTDQYDGYFAFYKPGGQGVVLLENYYENAGQYTKVTSVAGSTPIGYSYLYYRLLEQRFISVWTDTSKKPMNVVAPSGANFAYPDDDQTTVQMANDGTIYFNDSYVGDVDGNWKRLAAPPGYSNSIVRLTVQPDGTALGFCRRAQFDGTSDYGMCRWNASGAVQLLGSHAPISYSQAFIVQSGDLFFTGEDFWDAKMGRTIRYTDVLPDTPLKTLSEASEIKPGNNGRLFLAYNSNGFADFYVLDPVE